MYLLFLLQQQRELTPEEKLAERIRLQKIQEEADLKIAKGLFGIEFFFFLTVIIEISRVIRDIFCDSL